MKKIAIGLGAFVVLVVVILLVAPFLIPLDTYKAKLVEQVKAATGRDLRIDGPVRLSIIPRLALGAEKIAFANAPGAASPDMARIGKLELVLQLWPLIGGEVAVDSFVLEKPVIALEVDERGRPNWVFDAPAPASGGAPAAQPAPAASPAAKSSGGASPLHQIRLGDVRLVDGGLTYVDRRPGGAQYDVSEVNAKLALPGLDAPFRFDGGLVWQKRKITLVVDADKPRAFLEGGSTPFGIHLATDLAKLDLKTETTVLPAPKLQGEIDLAITSIRELAAWTGHPLAMAGDGLGPASFKGQLAAQGTSLTLSDAKLSLDKINGTGEFGVDTGGKRPSVKAKLALDRLDLNPYMPPPAQPAKPGAAPAPAAPAGSAPAGAAPPAPAGSGDWSDDPIDVSGLNAVDAELDLSLGSLHVQKIEIGKSVVAVRLKDGRLAVDMPELALYKGAGKGTLAVQPSGPGLALDASFQLAGLEAEPFLKDAMDFDRLSGTGNFDVTVASKGKSQRELIGALGGKGDLAFKDGAIKGIDLASMSRNIENALSQGMGGAQKTDFAELGGTFTITSGLLRNNDLVLKSPLLQAAGAGTVDLPKRTVDYRVTPKVAGLSVPVIVQGPWSNVSYRPDVGAAVTDKLSDPGKLLESLGRGSGSPAAPSTAPGAAPAPKSSNPLDVLKGLGGRR